MPLEISTVLVLLNTSVMRLCFILDGDDYSDDAFDEDKVSSIVI